ncbi:MAG: ubiquitin-like small modifier protein 1 [Acidobacteriota bacterium]
MPVRFLVPGPLRDFAGGRTHVEVAGSPQTLRDALRALEEAFPGVVRRVLDERGEVRPHVNLFVGEDCVRFGEGLATPVPEGCEIAILPAVSGG